MKKLLKKVVSVGLTAAMTLSMAITGIASASAATYYYNTYSTVADIKNRDGCSAMQGMAVGSTYLYTVKIKDDNSGAVLQKTNKNTGATTNLTNSTGKIYTYLNHANDMDVTTIDGYSQLFVATMATGGNSLVRIKVNGSKATKSGGYNLIYNGAQKSVSGVAIERTDANNVYLLLKSGATVYRGTVPKAATSGNIYITKAFTLNTSSVKVNGSYVNLSSYTHQGMGCYDGKIFVPLWGGGAGKSNQAVIAVYNTANASGTITSDPNLSFRITSGAYTGFEIESCDISSDGKMYFNVNRWTSKSGNHDAILCFNGYTYNSSIFTPVSAPAPAPTPAPAPVDTTPPSIGNVRITEVSENGYRVTCYVWDESGITSVKFPTWTSNNGQDDLIWHEGTVSGNTATCYISRNDHKGEYGTYYTHIYAYDPYGNQTCNGDTSVNVKQDFVNLGDDFYTNISFNGANLSLNGDNVVVYEKNGTTQQNWHFIRQSDGSYKIVNMYNGKCLDVLYASSASGANVQVCGDNGCDAQRWYLYEQNGKYVFKVACAPNTALDVDCGKTDNNTNVQMVTYKNCFTQEFEINKTNLPANVGDDFYANITFTDNNDVTTNLSFGEDKRVKACTQKPSLQQIWHFVRQTEGDYIGSYLIMNTSGDDLCLDVDRGWAVQVDSENQNTPSDQRWYIYDKGNDKYEFFVVSQGKEKALDVPYGKTEYSLEIAGENGGWTQVFGINKTTPPANIGDDFYANISFNGANLSLNGDNVVVYEKNGTTQQNWHFIRQSDGSYKIVNMYNGKCLDVLYASSASGANVQVCGDNGCDAQRWYLYEQNGKYVFKAACAPNTALDVDYGKTDNNTNVQMVTYKNCFTQEFEINK